MDDRQLLRDCSEPNVVERCADNIPEVAGLNPLSVESKMANTTPHRKTHLSTVTVEAVLGRTASLPCDIEPEETNDRVYMVLWFRESAGKPLYSITSVLSLGLYSPYKLQAWQSIATSSRSNSLVDGADGMTTASSYDVRGRQFSKALYWSETSAFGPRAFFMTVAKPAALTVDNIQLDDEGVYRCRVDFQNSPTRNHRINLTVTVPPHQILVYDASGLDVTGAIGPLQEDDNLVLTCEVRGAKPNSTERNVLFSATIRCDDAAAVLLLVVSLLISNVHLAAATTTTVAPNYPNALPEQLVQQMRTARTTCLKETGTSDEEIAAFNQPEPVVPSESQSQPAPAPVPARELQCYMQCMFRAFNVTKADGNLDLVEAYHTIPKQFNSIALKVFAKCHSRVEGDDPCARAYSHHRCWKETEPAVSTGGEGN
ncbi:hypothetical protein AND_006832 [Anopheles darlingi]|uniref:Ig-like domain-containing protein n=1 Tax=Anopheles darlingi TaxID=43151 RepID=W5JAM9_ANODA|nr:hypothetical protein AND_006832 [Anopheles darlingi]